MQAQTQVRVQVNERQALRNGRYAFSDRFTLVTELLQNSRRAGATEIGIEYDAANERLTVTDDGTGIGDFQALLTFHQSGWPQEVADAEHPFGIGFSNCLYAARHVEVVSRGLRLTFDTDKALEQEPLSVLAAPDAEDGRTIVSLEGVALAGLDERIARIVRGFPVKVVYNGVALPRSHCEATRRFHRTPIGQIRIAGEFDGQCTRSAAWYLQGLLVGDCDYFCDNERLNIVHLDSSRFMARLPDRRTLIDADQQRVVIEQAISSLWRDVLVARRLELDAESFSDRFWDAAHCFGHAELFDDLPVLPRQVCREFVGYPTQDEDKRHLQEPPRPLRREDIEARVVRVVDEASFEDDAFVALMYLRARGYVTVRSWELGEGHWIHQHLLRLDNVTFDVVPTGRVLEVEFEGRWVWPSIAFCDAVEIACGDDRVTINDDAVWDGSRVLYPREASGGDAVRQVSSYVDEDDRFREDDRDSDCSALADLARRMRCSDPLQALSSLLGELRLATRCWWARPSASPSARTTEITTSSWSSDGRLTGKERPQGGSFQSTCAGIRTRAPESN